MSIKTDVLSGRTFLTSLIADKPIFADEVDKFYYLKLLKRMLKFQEYKGVAFALLNSELHLILYAKADDGSPDEWILKVFQEDYVPWYEHRHAVHETVEESVNTVGLCEEQALIDACIRIHLLPKRAGYVNWAADYWWSSALAYLGHVNWDFIEPELLLSLFDTDIVKARKSLTKAAKKMYGAEFGDSFGYNR